MIMKTKLGILVDIVVGIVGALIGGFLLSFFVDTASGGWWFTLFTAILGAVIRSGSCVWSDRGIACNGSAES